MKHQYKYNQWTIQWEGDHEDYAKDNKFVLIDKEIGQIITQITFHEDDIEFKAMLLESIKINPKESLISIVNPTDLDLD
ncbi:hypothetical protein [Aquibacillus kalidii]|uniref:hypothetical protein n=1 Tax=Aquibacillus kalidii TaxID=2762597 RepID=UPI001647F9D4|nr:hypothetical protein [Aquibacillus kalidii]